MNIIQLKNWYIEQITKVTNEATAKGFPAFTQLYCLGELQKALTNLDTQQSQMAGTIEEDVVQTGNTVI